MSWIDDYFANLKEKDQRSAKKPLTAPKEDDVQRAIYAAHSSKASDSTKKPSFNDLLALDRADRAKKRGKKLEENEEVGQTVENNSPYPWSRASGAKIDQHEASALLPENTTSINGLNWSRTGQGEQGSLSDSHTGAITDINQTRINYQQQLLEESEQDNEWSRSVGNELANDPTFTSDPAAQNIHGYPPAIRPKVDDVSDTPK